MEVWSVKIPQHLHHHTRLILRLLRRLPRCKGSLSESGGDEECVESVKETSCERGSRRDREKRTERERIERGWEAIEKRGVDRVWERGREGQRESVHTLASAC